MPMNPRLLRPKAAPSTGFDPRSIGTMVAWYDFSDSSTLTVVNNFVSEIRNKSGSAGTMSQGTEADRPSISTLGGRQAAQFDGSNDYLAVRDGSNNLIAAPQGFGTLFAAFGNKTNVSNNVVAGFMEANGSRLQAQIGSALVWGVYARTSGGTVYTVSTSAVNASVWVGYTVFDNANSPSVFLNGAGASGTAAAASNTNAQVLGASIVNNNPGNFLSCALGEVLFYQDALNASQLSAVEQYLKAKWGASY
jgi:hypothetical protein